MTDLQELISRLERDFSPDKGASSGTVEDVLRGVAIELWSDASGRLFIVADEKDARRLAEVDAGVARGEIYTASELRRVIQIKDPALVAEVHRWKYQFNATIHEK